MTKQVKRICRCRNDLCFRHQHLSTLEGAIGIDEHIYRDNRAYDRWGINPFELFEFISQILDDPEIKRKELHDTEYFPTRYLCDFELNKSIYPCIIGIKESDQGLVIVITILDQKKRIQ